MEASYQRAIEIARRHQAKAWELQAATSLSRLWQAQGKVSEAHPVLAEIYGWFTEGFATGDLIDTKALLEAMTGGDLWPILGHSDNYCGSLMFSRLYFILVAECNYYWKCHIEIIPPQGYHSRKNAVALQMFILGCTAQIAICESQGGFDEGNDWHIMT